eukprot:TRINITY_DN22506_c0_g1_i1.p1 TRINITY_DN22506_c0_g1~~TRINITY_DN22506_c0_g1_i1.p1  ORF type:complete len:730 (+),score=431.74 TRINITY_DN22506_c0_g1_i1:69-2258(+)
MLRCLLQRQQRVKSAAASRALVGQMLKRFKSSSSSAAQAQAVDNSIQVTVNGEQVSIPNGATVLRACEEAGVEVPRFCYHDRLSIAGNCRMCLVEVEKSPKPVASCAMPAMPGMVIKTDTDVVHKAREGVMEFLLANHPLDCPICDQGGECDLQDQSLVYGSDRSRFKELKRTVEDKDLGPFVKTIMTRCIHCTRCVRFTQEVAGIDDLGTTGRGNAMEIGTYVDKKLDSEMSGNVIDLCPVGALTSRPFAFNARPWELDQTETIDVMDAVGAPIRIDSRGPEILRVLPRLNEDINEEWISDKTRFAYDGLKRQRLDTPLVRSGDEFRSVSWAEALTAVAQQIAQLSDPSTQIKAIAGDQADAEAIMALKDLVNRLGSNNTECRQDGARLSADLRSDYTFNSTIAGIEDADLILLVGTNVRMESPLLNSRIRKGVVHYGTTVASIGPKADLTYDHQHLGDTAQALVDLAAGKHEFSAQFKAAERPMVIVGQGALRRADGEAVLAAARSLASVNANLSTPEWNGVNVLQLAAGRAAGLDLGFVPGPNASDADVKFVYLLGADDMSNDVAKAAAAKGSFVVYQGHHGDAGAELADVILPGAAYTEKDATYVNTEGRAQNTTAAVTRLADAREDWQIVRALSEVVGKTLPYDTLTEVRARMADVAPHLARIGEVERTTFTESYVDSKAAKVDTKAPFARTLDNFFMTDPISRSSKNMARASKDLPNATNNYQ